jgi:hypothetical protein
MHDHEPARNTQSIPVELKTGATCVRGPAGRTIRPTARCTCTNIAPPDASCARVVPATTHPRNYHDQSNHQGRPRAA